MSSPARHGGTSSLVIDFVAPIVIYYSLRGAGVGLYPAVLAAAVAPGVGAVVSVIRSQRIGPLAALSLSGLAIAVAMSLAGGGTRLLLAKEGWVTAITGVWFLASAGIWRPLAMVFTQPFLQAGGG